MIFDSPLQYSIINSIQLNCSGIQIIWTALVIRLQIISINNVENVPNERDKSFINNANSEVPNTKPCGTPNFVGSNEDLVLLQFKPK